MYFGDHFLPKDNPNLKIIKGDIRDHSKIKKACEGSGVGDARSFPSFTDSQTTASKPGSKI